MQCTRYIISDQMVKDLIISNYVFKTLNGRWKFLYSSFSALAYTYYGDYYKNCDKYVDIG